MYVDRKSEEGKERERACSLATYKELALDYMYHDSRGMERAERALKIGGAEKGRALPLEGLTCTEAKIVH
jgi:hypothetical protein